MPFDGQSDDACGDGGQMKIVRSYSLDALRDLFHDEEIRQTGNIPPPVSAITSAVNEDGVRMIIVEFGGDEDEDNG